MYKEYDGKHRDGNRNQVSVKARGKHQQQIINIPINDVKLNILILFIELNLKFVDSVLWGFSAVSNRI